MKVAFLTTDNREHWKKYDGDFPLIGPAPQAVLKGFAELKDAEVHVISVTRQAMKNPEKIAPNIYFHSVLIPRWGMMQSLYLPAVLAVRKRIQEISPDIVHGQGTEREAAMAGAFSGKPNVLTIHGNMRQMLKYTRQSKIFHILNAGLEFIAVRKTHGVFCNSVYTRNIIQRDNSRTWIVPNPISPDFFAPVEVSPRNEIPVILNIGVIGEHKNQLKILELIRRLNSNTIVARFLFVGSCPDNEYGRQFKKEIQELASLGFADYAGAKDTRELIGIMDRSDALLHIPSEESFGLVIVEAAARGLKIFGAHVGGLIDTCAFIEGAELFPLDDSNSLISSIAAWSHSARNRLFRNQETMKVKYHPKSIASRHMEIYREVLQSKNTL